MNRITCFAYAAAIAGCVALSGQAGLAAAPGANPAPATSSAQAAKPPQSGTLGPSQPAVSDDPAKVAAAREYVLLHTPRMNPLNLATMLDRVMPAMAAGAKKRNPKLNAREYARNLKTRIMESNAAMLDAQARAISRHFTLPELKQLIAFSRSPVGRKMAAETPRIQRDVMIIIRQKRLPPLPRMALPVMKMAPAGKAAPSPKTPDAAGKAH